MLSKPNKNKRPNHRPQEIEPRSRGDEKHSFYFGSRDQCNRDGRLLCGIISFIQKVLPDWKPHLRSGQASLNWCCWAYCLACYVKWMLAEAESKLDSTVSIVRRWFTAIQLLNEERCDDRRTFKWHNEQQMKFGSAVSTSATLTLNKDIMTMLLAHGNLAINMFLKTLYYK